jgi:predicted RNase H-like HicB family nuclease
VKYTVVFEKAANNFAAYVPDLPGCIATGATREEVERNIREAVAFHVGGLKQHGEEVPTPEPGPSLWRLSR